ncbi:hypothetical protein Pcinc_035619 [Petrolisthes cinctipes]|uniref:Uncharacterized protein n=1 Tax=Petrolisthes cinctipes TaxID=88211 RepID=A0AAE1BW68_PETCI|nr:hypothetical protein Pcinc_035619 [Petrolisthes cinctipes]
MIEVAATSINRARMGQVSRSVDRRLPSSTAAAELTGSSPTQLLCHADYPTRRRHYRRRCCCCFVTTSSSTSSPYTLLLVLESPLLPAASLTT